MTNLIHVPTMSRPPSASWIGVDFDCTLAYYTSWGAPDELGEPIPLMLNRVKTWIAQGKHVKIFTARADIPEAVVAIKKWTVKHLGIELEVTNVKDLAMIELWDDRAIQMIPNTGIRADGK